jgi:hypothetical protein
MCRIIRTSRKDRGKASAKVGPYSCDEIGDDPRHQDFVRLRPGHDARSRMHSDAADIPTPDFDFACVRTRANGQADLP